MILKGNQRAYGQELAHHLLNVEDNEHATLHEMRGFLADDLFAAFYEAEAISLGTKCQQYLFSLSLNPPTSAKVSVAEFEDAITEIERRLGLSGQPRAIIFHEKKGRRHAHCVWSRIDVAKMRAINLPHYKRRLMDISRELYIAHDWDMPDGLRNRDERDASGYSGAEASQAKRAKRDPTALKKIFKSCWEVSDSRTAFAAALWEKGFCLARGDRRGVVAVDAESNVYAVSRWSGVRAKDVRARFGPCDDLPNVEQAVELLLQARNGFEQSRQNADRDARDRLNEAVRRKVLELVARQRQERDALTTAHEGRRLQAINARQDQFPTGLKAVWARVTGRYQAIVNECAEQATRDEARDTLEQQALVDRHIAEQRALNREFEFAQAKHAFEQELRDSENAQARIYHPDPLQPLVLPRDDVPFTKEQLRRNPALILDHISDKKARFTRTDILRGLTAFIDDPLALRVACDQTLTSPNLIRLENEMTEAFTTRDFVSISDQLGETVAELAQSGRFKVSQDNLAYAIKRENASLQDRLGASLSDEQEAAVKHLMSPQQLSIVVGLAGAGKSTLLAVARDAWVAQGYQVFGAALAGKAADSLQTASGIPSRTLASLESSWNSGYEPVGQGSIVVIDEAGMVGTRQLARVADQLRMRGCKLVLVGDPDQLQPIQAGKPFKKIAQAHTVARLTEIRRQSSAWQRDATRTLAEGQTASALQSYADHQAVHEKQNRDEAIAALVEDYMVDWQNNGSDKSRIALAHRRKDVHAINQAIKSAQATPISENLFNTDHGPRTFAAGDRILFTRNDRDLGVRNGMLGTVEKVSNTKLIVTFDPDDLGASRRLTFSPKDFPSIDHGFAVSIHRAQGCTVDRSFVLASTTLDENLTYVALTRHKEETGLYSAPDIAPRRLKIDPCNRKWKGPTRSR